MKVSILYFASLREALGMAREELELPAEVATLSALRNHLHARGGAFATALAPNRAVRAAVNQDMVRGDCAIKSGDEVAFFPPVTGG